MMGTGAGARAGAAEACASDLRNGEADDQHGVDEEELTRQVHNTLHRRGHRESGLVACWSFKDKDGVDHTDDATIEAKHAEKARRQQDVPEGRVGHLKGLLSRGLLVSMLPPSA